MYRLLYGLSKSYNPENRDKFVSLLEKLSPYLPEKKTHQLQISAGGWLGILPKDVVWQILLFMNDEEILRLEGIDEIDEVLKMGGFWKERLEIKFPLVKKYGYPQFLKSNPNYSSKLQYKLLKSGWREKYVNFNRGFDTLFRQTCINLVSPQIPGGFTIDDVQVLLSPNDKSFIYEVIKYIKFEIPRNKDMFYKKLFTFLNDETKKEKEIIFEIAIGAPQIFWEDINENLKKNREFILDLVKHNADVLEYVDEKFKNDEDIVMTAVKTNGDALKHANERLKDNYKIVMESIKYKSNSPIQTLGGDEPGIFGFMGIDIFWVLQYASKRLKNIYDVCFAAVKKDPFELMFAPEKYKNNFKIVMMAVKKKGELLKYASGRLKNNADICIEAIKNDPMSFHEISEVLFVSETFRKMVKTELGSKIINPESPYNILSGYLEDPKNFLRFGRNF